MEALMAEASLFSEHGDLKPYAAQQLLTRVYETDLTERAVSVPQLIERYGVSWVLLSFTAEFRRPVRPGMRLRPEIRSDSREGLIFRRDIALLDEAGGLALAAAAFFAVIDVRARRICRDEAILAKLTQPAGGEQLLLASSRPDYRAEDFSPLHRRSVYPSWIDEVGHVGNLRYGEMSYDALSPERRRALSSLARVRTTFMRELHEGDEVEILVGERGNSFRVLGARASDGAHSFLTEYEFYEG